MSKRGWLVELRQTEKAGDATLMAREAAQIGCDMVIVAGGDGTVNEAVNGLVGTQTALGVLPVGTGNRWARQLRIPTYMVVSPLLLFRECQSPADRSFRASRQVLSIGLSLMDLASLPNYPLLSLRPSFLRIHSIHK